MLITLGRISLGAFFVLAGISKLMGYAPTLEMMADAGMPLTGLLLPPTIALEIGGGLWLASGRRGAGCVALVLAGFTLLTNLVFHAFWAIDDPVMSQLELSLFFKNLAIMGGLFLVAGERGLRRRG